MKEVSSTADGGSTTRSFSQEIAEDHIHMTPDYTDEADRALLRGIRGQNVPADTALQDGQNQPETVPPRPEQLLPGPKGNGQPPPPIDKPPAPPAEVPVAPIKAPVEPNPGEVAPAAPAAVQSCADSPEYLKILERARDYMYEPDRLGDYETLKTKFNCQIQNVDDAIKYAGEALAITKDPYNSVFDKKQSESRSNDSRGVFKGFGFNFAPAQDVDGAKGAALPSRLKVTGIMTGSPAELQNRIKPGDYIVAVGNTALKGKTFDEAYSLVKSDGAKDFSIQRDKKQFKVSLAPGDVPIPAVTDKRLAGNIAYIDLKTFGQQDTANQLRKSIENNLAADAFIIDLRQNPGGFFDESIKAASLFVKDGTVVTVRERIPPEIAATGNVTITPPLADGTVNGVNENSGDASIAPAKPAPPAPPRPNYQSVSYDLTPTGLNKVVINEGTKEQKTVTLTRLPDLVDKPTVILVDHDSASSSEVFAGALKDHKDAVVIGTRTYGKGIGQMNFYDMPNGSSLRVTNFHYFNPSGHWPGDADRNRIGIQPDQLVTNPAGTVRNSDKDLQLAAGIAQINKMLGRAPKVIVPPAP
jgi:C-terminal peptidase prc